MQLRVFTYTTHLDRSKFPYSLLLRTVRNVKKTRKGGAVRTFGTQEPGLDYSSAAEGRDRVS